MLVDFKAFFTVAYNELMEEFSVCISPLILYCNVLVEIYTHTDLALYFK